jgi:hypothetical protein
MNALRHQVLLLFSVNLLLTVAPSVSRAVERFTNGDFELGASGFGSDYSFNGVDNTLPGQFAVTTSPHLVHPSWGIYADNTVVGANMLTANGTTAAGLAVWRQTVSVVPGADYTFSAWGASSFSTSPALLSFRANDVEFLTLQLPTVVGRWTTASTVVNAGTSTSIEFEIVDLNLDGLGNDLTLDDISLDGSVPIPEPSAFFLATTPLLALLFGFRRR